MRWKRQIAIPCFAGTGATTARDDGVVRTGLWIGQGGLASKGAIKPNVYSQPTVNPSHGVVMVG